MNPLTGILCDIENYNDIDAFTISLEALPPIGAKFEINGAVWIVADIVWYQYKERSLHWRPCITFAKIKDLEDAGKGDATEHS